MKLITFIQKMQQEVRRLHRRGKTIGFVPTMGAHHEGHLSLVRTSKKENDVTVVSIFVNPLQFGPKEDLKKYPRPVKKDLALLRKEKVDFVFMPSGEEMYPEGRQWIIDEINQSNQEPVTRNQRQSNLTNQLCGKFRPGHFQGVLTVVAKLFNIVRPDRAYFGVKDYQQAKVIERLNQDLNFGIEIRIMPTVRDPDGLAMSSRNQYLNPEDCRRARMISQVLFGLKVALLTKRIDLSKGLEWARREMARLVDQVQYLEIVDPETLQPLEKIQPEMLLAAACYVGKTRLIDNVIISLPKKKPITNHQ